IRMITRCFGGFEAIDNQSLDKPAEQKSSRGRHAANPKPETAKTFASKIFNTTDFGYRRITIERPLRLSVQLSDERLEALRFAPKPFNAPMQWIWQAYGGDWDETNYGQLADVVI
ncbi:hypothetical protein, partial [Gilvimarinus sp. 1_MG-2023]|uniref:hypothetical protein n=1 Tax=Gilvimarinus sp. 1_MG-2023 TaxID=3062638 RepID=UPI0026E2E250